MHQCGFFCSLANHFPVFVTLQLIIIDSFILVLYIVPLSYILIVSTSLVDIMSVREIPTTMYIENNHHYFSHLYGLKKKEHFYYNVSNENIIVRIHVPGYSHIKMKEVFGACQFLIFIVNGIYQGL